VHDVASAEVADCVSRPADGLDNRPRRPFGLWVLTLALLASPLLHAAALLLHARWLNFGSPRLWDGFVYFLIAPIVGMLMLRRHERARFSAYVFLSCEILRAVRIHSPALGLLAVGFVVYLQLPAARAFHPSIDPRQVVARLRLKRHG
jgi:ABC-type amino acid transport system permease subunit